jgi:hypothetical protein
MALGGSYASGTDSFAAGGAVNTSSYGATGANSVAIGQLAKAQGTRALAMQNNATASGTDSIAIGRSTSASGTNSVALGYSSAASYTGKFAYAATANSSGSEQFGLTVFRASTTGSTVVMTSDGSAAGAANQLIAASNQVLAVTGTLIGKQTGSANIAAYTITATVVNNAGTLTVPTATLTLIGTDSIGLTTSPTLTADNTNKCMAITSGAKTATNIRWVATTQTSEVTYA